MEFWQTLIISILASVVTGFFAVLGVVLTIRQNNKQLQVHIKNRQDEINQRVTDMRPEFDIKSMQIKEIDDITKLTTFSDINCLRYDSSMTQEDVFDKWKVYTYRFTNIGQQLIECVDLFALQKNALFNLDECALFLTDIDELQSRSGQLTYFKKRIKQDDEFTITVCVPLYQKIANFPTVSCCLVCKSFDKRLWRQNLYLGEQTIEEANLITREEFNELILASRCK